MRGLILAALAALLMASSAHAERVVIREHTECNGTSCSSDAEYMARTGRFAHRGHHGSGYEGIGFSTRSADDALRNCCYWGKRTVREKSVVRGPRGWYAVVRYN